MLRQTTSAAAADAAASSSVVERVEQIGADGVACFLLCSLTYRVTQFVFVCILGSPQEVLLTFAVRQEG